MSQSNVLLKAFAPIMLASVMVAGCVATANSSDSAVKSGDVEIAETKGECEEECRHAHRSCDEQKAQSQAAQKPSIGSSTVSI